MPEATSTLEAQYRAAIDVVAAVSRDVGVYRAQSEKEALKVAALQAELAREVAATGVVVAGDLAYRSRPELGGDGLARRSGFRTVENLVKATTGASKQQATTAVNAGQLLVETADDGTVDLVSGEVRLETKPWLKPVAIALAAGSILPVASDAIARGLKEPNSAITSAQLEGVARTLVAQAISGVDADQLRKNASDLRVELDLAGVKIREEEVRAVRSLTHWPLPEGGGMAQWRMDDETYAQFVDFYERTTSPKRGGVRFVDPAKVEKARKIEDDPRTYQQFASDTLLQLMRLGAEADPNVMMGSGAPIIRVTVAADALETGVGLGRIDGQSQPISIDSVKRLMETGKQVRMGFDPGGTYIEVNQDPLADNRLFNAKQREILAAKFGGCMFPGCDRPPSWCEAHHIQFVKRDGGKTVIANGILFCKHHHLLLHDRGYEVVVDEDGDYWLIPPKEIDDDQLPVAMPLKGRNLRDMLAAHQRLHPDPAEHPVDEPQLV